ncbi:MAG: HRDC domain-containing protein [bacterium]
MDVRVLTLRYQEGQQGFPEGALRQATAGREVLEVREHFFTHGNVPHVALVLLLGDGAGDDGGFRSRNPNAPDPEESIPEDRRPVYRDLKRWRNDRAKTDGKPAYAIARNVQLAEIVNKAPKSLAALKEIEGLGEAFCRDYGAAVLELVKTLPEATQDEKPHHEERQGRERTDVGR